MIKLFKGKEQLDLAQHHLSQHLAIKTAGAGPTLLCLHGHPGNGDCMQVFSQHFATRFQTLCPDLRGYGRNRTSRHFAMSDHLKDLEALLAAQTGDIWLLGWSLGGILAMELALCCPERVKGLILIATSAYPRSNHPAVGWRDYLNTVIASLLNGLRPGWDWNIQRFGRNSLYRYLVRQQTPATYRFLAQYALLAYLQTSRYAERALQQSLRQRYNRLADLSQIHCPALVLAGEQDCHITAACSHETAQHLPNSDWILYSDVAHLFPWEIPGRVLADIDAWFERQT
jgi:pimeloyl-ACP methyl ester carboxylesterase